MKPLGAVNCHGTAGCCLSVGTVLSLRYSQSCFLCIVSTASYWLDGIRRKVQTVQSEQWPPNFQPQLRSTQQKLEFEDVRLTSHSISELQCHNRMFSSRKQAYFTFPWEKNVSFRNCLNAVTQPHTQTFSDNNYSSMSTEKPVKQDT